MRCTDTRMAPPGNSADASSTCGLDPISLVGARFEVLVDTHHTARNQWAGRTTSNRIVNFSTSRENLLGQYVQVHITRSAPNSLIGEEVQGGEAQ